MPSSCRGSEPLPTFQTQLEIAVASHRALDPAAAETAEFFA